MLPKTFFLELAEKAPIVIFKNRLYQVSNHSKSKDYIDIKGEKLNLVLSDSLLNLENYYRYLNAKTVYDHKQKIINNIITDADEDDYEDKDNLDNKTNNYRLISFIVNEIFPYFKEDESEVDDLLSDKKVKVEKKESLDDTLGEVSKKLAELRRLRTWAKPISKSRASIDGIENREIERLLSTYYNKPVSRLENSKDDDPATLLSEALEFSNIITFKDVVYLLNRKKSSDIKVNIDGKEYYLEEYSDTKRIEDAYIIGLQDQLEREAETDLKNEKMVREKIVSQKSSINGLEKLVNKKSYEEGSIGFIINTGGVEYDDMYGNENFQVFVTLRVPSYVLQSVDNSKHYYKFKECRVAVGLAVNNGEIEYSKAAFVVESYSHPFLSNSNTSWQDICLGPYKWDKLSGIKSKTTQIATLLSDARDVLQKGYNRNCTPMIPLGSDDGWGYDDDFKNYRISLNEVKKKKLPITNIDKKMWERIKNG